ncbi:MAG: glycosyltransferase [Planctomycetes bacterium]|nr:glycosyltransferase [Planctomycetota bacterium]
MSLPLTVLSVSHSCVVAEYRERMSQVLDASDGDVRPLLLTPRHWRQFNREIHFSDSTHDTFPIEVRQPYSSKFMKQGLRNSTHFYHGVRKLLASIKPDIIEMWEEPFFLVTAQFLRAARQMSPVPRFIFFSAQNIPRRYPFPFHQFENYVLRHADHCWAMNQEAVEVLRNKNYRQPATILPLGIDPAVFNPGKRDDELKRELFPGFDGPLITYIGRLDACKGVLDLARAAQALKGDYRLLIIGSGEAEAEVRNELDWHLREGRAILKAGIAHDQVPSHLHASEIVVMPSRTVPGVWKEQFGRVLVEGMACGAVPVGSDSGEIPVVIGNAGIVFPEGDVPALTQVLQRLLDHPNLRAELRLKGFSKVESEYTWRSIALRQIEVYHSLVTRTR